MPHEKLSEVKSRTVWYLNLDNQFIGLWSDSFDAVLFDVHNASSTRTLGPTLCYSDNKLVPKKVNEID